MRYWDNWNQVPKSRPRAAKGGIKAQSQRGSFGRSWWGRRWLAVLESFQIGARLQRGRSYARGGQVLGIAVEKGVVTASVQGSRPAPYAVGIAVKTLDAQAWKKVTGALSAQAIFAAKLLSGEMPAEIEQVFRDAKLSLFPEQLRDLRTECSCPDWSNPCKHIAAVYYLLSEEFDRDPFLIFRLRGISREELAGQLRPAAGEAKPEQKAEPLPEDPERFWRGGPLPEDLLGDIRTPRTAAALIERLGPFPFWRGEAPLVESLRGIYRAAAERAVARLLE